VHNERKRFSSAEAKHEQQLLLILIISKTLFLVAGCIIVVNHISFYDAQKARRQSFAEMTFVRVM
jgi:flagellar basal body-associated protein FliL